MPALNQFFYPKSIAVVGASTKDGSVGNDLLKNLLKNNYSGRIFPVNPKTDNLLDLKCYPKTSDLPEIPDLALIAVPAKFVIEVLEELGQFGVKNTIIISAGFKEIGHDGLVLENQVSEICKKYNIQLLGVNCLGMMNPGFGLNATFSRKIGKLGNVALVSQSGAFCTAAIDSSSKYDFGFSKVISLGNQTGLKEIDFLEYLDGDPETRVTMLYLENIAGENFLERAKKLKKPVVLIKTGRFAEGQKAASSHTGALAGEPKIYEAIFKQAGLTVASNIQEFFYLAEVFSKNPLPAGPEVVILTNAGGPGALTVDAISENNLKITQLTQETKQKLSSFLPPSASVHNPVDILGDADSQRYEKALEILTDDPNIQSILTILTPQSTTEPDATAKVLSETHKKSKKLIFTSFMGHDDLQEAKEFLREKGVTNLDFPDQAARSIGALWSRKKYLLEKEVFQPQLEPISTENRQKARELLENEKNSGSTLLQGPVVSQILSLYGLKNTRQEIIYDLDKAVDSVKKVGGNAVFKIISKDIAHKSNVGGVITGVTVETATENYAKILENISKNAPNSSIEGVLVMEMVNLKEGVEFFLGAKDQGILGKSTVIGLGGILVEALQDLAFGVGILDFGEAQKMIDSLRSKKLLDKFRGREELDILSLKTSIIRLSELIHDCPTIAELDINPLLILPKNQGTIVLDARIILAN